MARLVTNRCALTARWCVCVCLCRSSSVVSSAMRTSTSGKKWSATSHFTDQSRCVLHRGSSPPLSFQGWGQWWASIDNSMSSITVCCLNTFSTLFSLSSIHTLLFDPLSYWLTTPPAPPTAAQAGCPAHLPAVCEPRCTAAGEPGRDLC